MKDFQSSIVDAVKNALKGTEGVIDGIDGIQANLVEQISNELNEQVTLNNLKSKLAVLFEYEKNYLELVKEYKEEIKFASTIQEDLRKERAKFFSDTLQEVSNTLSEAQIDNEVASRWLKELVGSYTKSLDLSSGLIEEHTLDMIGKIRSEAKSNKASVDVSNITKKGE